MKRLIALFLAAGLILSTSTAAQAVDFKVKGLSQHRLSWADRNFTKGNGDDNFKAASRLRTTIEAVVSESLKGVVFLEVGHQNWGVSRDGASLGTDGKQVKVSWSYVDWSVPKTETRVRMGLQPYTLRRLQARDRLYLMVMGRAYPFPTAFLKTWKAHCSGSVRATTTHPRKRGRGTPMMRWISSASRYLCRLKDLRLSLGGCTASSAAIACTAARAT